MANFLNKNTYNKKFFVFIFLNSLLFSSYISSINSNKNFLKKKNPENLKIKSHQEEFSKIFEEENQAKNSQEKFSILNLFEENLNKINLNFFESEKNSIQNFFEENSSGKTLKHFFEFSSKEKCGKENCENLNGSCIKGNICLCNTGFANINFGCNYRESFQKYALILEFVLPIGIGHFYCSRNLVGSIKFIFLFILPLFIMLMINSNFFSNTRKNLEEINIEKSENGNKSYLNFKKIFFFLYLMAFTLWFFFDLIMFAANFYKDGYGYDLVKI